MVLSSKQSVANAAGNRSASYSTFTPVSFTS
jgi:hypothetical protein